MNRRLLWGGIGAAFALAVGVGYVPDLVLAHQMRAARAEGLFPPKEAPPFVASLDDAALAYQQALHEEEAGLTTLRSAPAHESARPSPPVRRLLERVAQASKRKVYVLRMSSDDPWFGSFGSDLQMVAMALARSAPSEERLLAAARVVRHLSDGDPLDGRSQDWGASANGVLDGADRLRLSLAARGRVIRVLGKPDPVDLVRRHVVAALAEVEGDANRSAGFTRRKARFLSFWRGFLQTAPHEPAAFARAVREAEPQMVDADAGVDVSTASVIGGYWRPRVWHEWADGVARALGRMG